MYHNIDSVSIFHYKTCNEQFMSCYMSIWYCFVRMILDRFWHQVVGNNLNVVSVKEQSINLQSAFCRSWSDIFPWYNIFYNLYIKLYDISELTWSGKLTTKYSAIITYLNENVIYRWLLIGFAVIFRSFQLNFEALHSNLETIHGLYSCLGGNRVIIANKTWNIILKVSSLSIFNL